MYLNLNKLTIRFLLLVLGIFLILYLSYLFKNFVLFALAISLIILLGFFVKKINKNFLLSLFSIFFIFTLIEGFLFFVISSKSIVINKKTNYTSNIKYEKTFLGYQPKPGVHNYKIVTNGKVEIDKFYTIANNGFRVTPEINNLRKQKSLNFFGGSFAFGFGLNDDETMAYILQSYLKNWKINNYGINGYGVHQMLALIQKEPSILADINILMTVEGHIPRATCKRHFSFGTPKYVINKKKELIRSGNCQFGIMDKIPIPKIFGSIINRSEIKNYIFNSLNSEKTFYNDKSKKTYLAILKEIDNIVKKNDKILILGYMDLTTDLNREIVKLIIEKKISIIDLTLDKNNKKYWLPDRHTSKLGNEKRAFLIQDFLKKNLYID